MKPEPAQILLLDSLEIGYTSGKLANVLLQPVTASANKGELIAVIGRNGIGKSTLLRTLAGIQRAIGGDIYFAGKKTKDYSRVEHAQKIGYISTETIRVTNMSVYDLVSLGRFPYTNWMGKIGASDNEIILEAISKTSISGFRNKFISELSDGERQKAMIARILAQDTDIMIMDEPTAFLDIGSKYEILQLLHQLSRNENKTIIFSTHDLHLAINQADKIWLILNDHLSEGAPEDLMLAGAFNNLFESSAVKFDKENGTYSCRAEERGSIFIQGEGIGKHWTEEAVRRAGYSVSQKMTMPYIMLSGSEISSWRLIKQDSEEEFRSIYDLIRFLGETYSPAT